MNIKGNNSKKKPHFVSEVRIFRQYDEVYLSPCHVLFPLGNDYANLQYINAVYVIKMLML